MRCRNGLNIGIGLQDSGQCCFPSMFSTNTIIGFVLRVPVSIVVGTIVDLISDSCILWITIFVRISWIPVMLRTISRIVIHAVLITKRTTSRLAPFTRIAYIQHRRTLIYFPFFLFDGIYFSRHIYLTSCYFYYNSVDSNWLHQLHCHVKIGNDEH